MFFFSEICLCNVSAFWLALVQPVLLGCLDFLDEARFAMALIHDDTNLDDTMLLNRLVGSINTDSQLSFWPTVFCARTSGWI